jgi:hypothetical protein
VESWARIGGIPVPQRPPLCRIDCEWGVKLCEYCNGKGLREEAEVAGVFSFGSDTVCGASGE